MGPLAARESFHVKERGSECHGVCEGKAMADFRDGRNADGSRTGGAHPPGCGQVRGLTRSGLAAQQEVSSGASQH